MVIFGSMLPPMAMSGFKVLLQSGSMLMFEAQVTIKGLVLLPEAMLISISCAAAGGHASTLLNHIYYEKLMLTSVLIETKV